MRKRRRAVTPCQQQYAARKLAVNLGRNPDVRRSHRIACYLAHDGEISLEYFIQYARRTGKKLYLPILDRLYQTRLWFAPFVASTSMSRNCFGIREPAHSARHRLMAKDLDLILMPLVSFDTLGNRLGMGGGYYDKTLSFLVRREYWVRPKLIGVAYEFQKSDRLPARPWDVRLHEVVTDHTSYRW